MNEKIVTQTISLLRGPPPLLSPVKAYRVPSFFCRQVHRTFCVPGIKYLVVEKNIEQLSFNFIARCLVGKTLMTKGRFAFVNQYSPRITPFLLVNWLYALHFILNARIKTF